VSNKIPFKARAISSQTAYFLAELASVASLSGQEEKVIAHRMKLTAPEVK
jgi:hypothetical protein